MVYLKHVEVKLPIVALKFVGANCPRITFKAAFNLCLSPPQRPLRVVGRLGRGKTRKRAGDDGKGKGPHEKGNQLKHIRHFVNFTKWRMEVKRMQLSSSIFRKCGAILNVLYESRAQSSPARKLFLGTLRSEDDNGGEKVGKKGNSRSLNLHRYHCNSLTLSNIG